MKIVGLRISEVGLVQNFDKIEKFTKNGDIDWYRVWHEHYKDMNLKQEISEYNSKYIIEILYEI